MTEIAGDRSYRALLQVPTLGRVLVSMQIARTAQSMLSIALVLFTLATYDSPGLAGVVTFASVFPGLVASPVAGALLDRHGRVRLVVLDYVVALSSLVLIGGLALAGLLPAPLLVLIALVSSITGIFSHTGLRSLFPILVPRHLWERVNAVDSNGYVVATIIGPPLAAALVATIGGPATVLIIAVAFGIAAVVMIGVPEPHIETATTGRLLTDARLGLLYWWRNRTLRGLGFSLSVVNLAAGMTTIVIPLVVVQVLGAGEAVVGLVFALSGITGMASALVFGRVDTRGREWPMIVVPMALSAAAVALILPAVGAGGIAGGPGGRARLPGRSRPRHRPAPGPARRRPLHGPPAADRPGLDGACLRRLDGDQLHGLPGGRRGRRGYRGGLAARPPSAWGWSPASSAPSSPRP